MNQKQHTKTAPQDIVPLGQKIAYGFGSLANNLFTAVLGVFMMVLVQGMGMEPYKVGILGAAPRLFDAFTDLIMGYISDNTKSRWGRRRPYMFFGGLLTGISFMIMWQMDPDTPGNYNFWYFLSWSLVFYLGYTMFATPFIAIGLEMTPDFHERTKIMAFNNWFGQIAWLVSPLFWIIIYNQNMFESAAEGCRTLALWVGAACSLIAIIPAVFCKEPRIITKQEPLGLSHLIKNTARFAKAMVQTFKCGPFIRLCAATFCVFNGYQIVSSFTFFLSINYIYKTQTEAGNLPTWIGVASSLLTVFLVIPVATWLSKTFGKKKGFIITTIISIIGYSMRWWFIQPGQPLLIFVPIAFIVFGQGALFVYMLSMLADVCDLDELNTGERREGTFGAAYWWTVKIGLSMAMLVGGALLSWIGFTPGDVDTVQPLDVMNRIRIFDIALPVSTALMALWIIRKYAIDEERAHEMRAELEKRRGKMTIQSREDGSEIPQQKIDQTETQTA